MRKLRNEELERKSVDEFRAADKLPVVLLLDNVRSMNNVGSVFRTADAFLIEKIILCGFTPVPPHREIQKTALGATETVTWSYSENASGAIASMRKEGYAIYAVEQAEGSCLLGDFRPPAKCVLIFGNEVEGVQQQLVDQCDGCIEIPQSGMKHSLNIAVSTGIVVWEVTRKVSGIH